jgi:hypothetical protein
VTRRNVRDVMKRQDVFSWSQRSPEDILLDDCVWGSYLKSTIGSAVAYITPNPYINKYTIDDMTGTLATQLSYNLAETMENLVKKFFNES